MRKLLALFGPVFLVAFASSTIACSGETTEVEADEDATEEEEVATPKKSGTTNDSDDDADDADKVTEEEEQESSSAPPPAEDPENPTPPPADPGTNPPPATSACLPTSVAETESNDTEATANAIPGASGSFCGTLETATDVDHVKFTLPADFAGVSFKLSSSKAGATVKISVNGGAPVTLGQGAVPAVRSGNYVVRIEGAAGIAYRFNVELR